MSDENMIPIKLEFSEGTLLRKQQDEIDELDRTIFAMQQERYEKEIVRRSLFEQNRQYMVENDTLRKRLVLAVEALDIIQRLICEADPNVYRKRKVIKDTLAEIEKIGADK